MNTAQYYRKQAERAHRLADLCHDGPVRVGLERLAHDYAEMADDIETGIVEIRHSELLPQDSQD